MTSSMSTSGASAHSLLDDETATRGERNDRLDAARERARDDARDLTIRERPDELARDLSPDLVEASETVHAG